MGGEAVELSRAPCVPGGACRVGGEAWSQGGRAAACSSACTQRDAIVVCAPVIKATKTAAGGKLHACESAARSPP